MSKKSFEERFWAKVDKTGDCWEWTASRIRSGYGHFKIGRKLVLAHRVAWQLSNGSIPEGEGHHGTCVLHHCDNRGCVNPDHLFLGTNHDNVKDRDKKGRGVIHYGEAHGMSKLTNGAVRMIRKYYKDGACTQTWLATVYGVKQTVISDVINHKIWRHVDA